jgi:phage terminase large subunit-like protein
MTTRTKNSSPELLRPTKRGLVVVETGRVLPGTEPANAYCPRGCRHPWDWRPKRRDAAHWNDRGWRAVRFIETLCRHTKGRWKGFPFILLPFQLALVLAIFGTVDEAGLRLIREVYVEWARKNGKSELAAAIALYLLAADGEQSPEVYGAAFDEDQAGLVYAVAADMVEMKPWNALKRGTRNKAGLIVIRSRKRIVNPNNGGLYRTIPADEAGAHGFNASGIIFDEVHTQRTRELYDVLATSTDLREQPLIFAITTEGEDDNELLWKQLRDYAEKVATGVIEAPHFFSDVRRLPKDADWLDRRLWALPNPALGSKEEIAAGKAFRPMDRLEEKVNQALETPALQPTVRRLYLNQSVASRALMFPMAAWDESEDFDVEELLGREAWAGLDLSSREDLTALVLFFPDDDDEELAGAFLSFFFLPAEGLSEKSRRDGVAYDQYAEDGLLIATEGNLIDYAAIDHKFDELARAFRIRSVGFDNWGAVEVSARIEDAGIEVNPIPQTIQGLTIGSEALLRMVKGRRARGLRHPILRMMANNTVARVDDNERMKPDKKRSNGRIDGIVAGVMAVDGAVRELGLASAYEDHGLEVMEGA